MQLSVDRLREIQEAYKADFNEEITLEEAREIFQRLLAFYEVVLSPLPDTEGQTVSDA
jgi:hypothetical protein